MTLSTSVFMVSATIIVVLALYLTTAKCYRTGFFGSVGFMFVVIGFGSMIWEQIGGVDFVILPQVAMGTAGIALFLIQHTVRTRLFPRRKRDSTLGKIANGARP